MKVADNTNDQACSRRILSDFGRHNKQSFAMTSAAWRFYLSAFSTGFPKASREARNKWEARELETSEKREKGMMGTSALHEGGVMGS